MDDEVWRTMAWRSLNGWQISSSLSDSGLRYCGKSDFGHFTRALSSNSQLFSPNEHANCLEITFPRYERLSPTDY
ncbi:MAG: hypothetical protein ACI9DC_002026 [Gammaproteobacteria bacterium]|jgi:hypothetical protein